MHFCIGVCKTLQELASLVGHLQLFLGKLHGVGLRKFPYCSGFPAVLLFEGCYGLTGGTRFLYDTLVLALLELTANLRFGVLYVGKLLRCRVFAKKFGHKVGTLRVRHADRQLQIVLHVLRLLAHLQLSLISLGLVFRLERLLPNDISEGIKRGDRETAIIILLD